MQSADLPALAVKFQNDSIDGGYIDHSSLGDLGPRSLEAGLLVKLGKSLPGSEGKIDVGARAAGAEIHDGSLDVVAVVLDVNLLAAPGVGGLASHDVVGGLAPGGSGKSNNHVGVSDGLSASSSGASVVVDGDVDVLVLHGAAGTASGWGGGRSVSGRGCWGIGRGNIGRGGGLGLLDGLGLLNNGRGRRDYRSGRGGRSSFGGGRCGRGRNIGAGGLLGSRSRRVDRRLGSGLGWGARGLGDLVEVAGRSGGSLSDGLVVVPDGGVNNDGLGDDLGLVDERALVKRRSSDEGAEEGGSEDSGGLHFCGSW